MENNEINPSIRSLECRKFTSNGRIVVNNDSKDERATVAEISSKKSCSTSHLTEGSNAIVGGSGSNANNSHKMGSRRIFTPHFKLQVLESYRNDNDCKGNQRATARKYNIHRRQIQKWLQCESSLRSSVANINQNTVKHQFHNISIHQQQTQKSSIPAAASLIGVPYGASSQHTHLGLDVARSEAPHNSITVPSLSSGVTTSTTQTQGVFSAANLAAVVAAAAGAALTIKNPPSNNGTSAPNESVASPLHTSSIIAGSSTATATMSPLLHHHHHYGIPPYIHHTPASVQLPVPMLTHHISHTRQIHQQAQQHQPYQYHNMAYTQALTHQSSDKQQSSFLSSMSLPNVNALSAAASLATSNGYSVVGESEPTDPVESTSKVSAVNAAEGKSLEQSCRPKLTYPRLDYSAINHHHLYQFKEDGYAVVYPIGPMDLSLRTRRNLKTDLLSYVKEGDVISKNMENDSSIVDLTHRKRKVSSTACNSADDSHTGLCDEKQRKLKPDEDIKYGTNSNSDEDEVEIEVGMEEKLPPSKPVKLFKPYLLDADADSESSITISSGSTEMKCGETTEASPWIRYTASLSPPPSHCLDVSAGQCQGTTFQYSIKDNFSTPYENFNFPAEAKTEDLKSAFTSIPTISPTSFRSPKGSPSSSGYESSSSTYSDSSFSSRGESYAYNRTYCLSLQMHSLHHEHINLHRSKHVERWLEQEGRNPSEPTSPIAILA